MGMTPSEFARKWMGSTRAERAAAQEHFIDLCRMLGVPTPNQADPAGRDYAFEKGAEKVGGGDGFADVWRRGHFAWEYKGKRKDLKAAYQQLLQYREALENPPLLVVCDLDRFEVHTNFTNTPTVVHAFALRELLERPEEPLRVLRAVMKQPEALRPGKTREELTSEAAEQFASLALALRGRGHDPLRVAHFLNKLLFCMFAQDAGLLPAELLERLAEGSKHNVDVFTLGLHDLFATMSQGGGLFGTEPIDWFNGGLFDGADVLPLTVVEIGLVQRVSRLDWSQVEPAVFGTLFERGLDPGKRAQLGAHYTDRESILRVIELVLMAPLRRDFEATRQRVQALLAEGRRITARTPPDRNPHAVFNAFLARLRAVRVLDPACGSGNFLYLALQALKDLEREAILWASLTFQTTLEFPQVGPASVLGIELNSYAAELARVVIWIGEIQWMLANGFSYLREPILRPLDNVECRDSVLDPSDPAAPREPSWPAVKQTGGIFLAWSDEPWVVEGAAVHVSIIGYDDGTEPSRTLDGRPVTSINANLTAGLDLTRVRRLPENLGIGFMGDTKGGPFDIPETLRNGGCTNVGAACGSSTSAPTCRWTRLPCTSSRSST